MSKMRCRLSSGAEFVMECHHAPIAEELAVAFAAKVNADLDEYFLKDLLRGHVPGPVSARIICGAVNGRLIGTSWCGWRRSLPALGMVAGVTTSEQFRSQGMATALCEEQCERFAADGGRLLWLAPTTQSAQRIYERLGFEVVTGKLMCRRFAGSELNEGFAPGQRVNSRNADWGDLAPLAPLYAWPTKLDGWWRVRWRVAHHCIQVIMVSGLTLSGIRFMKMKAGSLWADS